MKSKATRLIGVDYGLARLGLAVSDESKLIAMPLQVMAAEKRTEKTVVKFLKLLEEQQKEKAYTVDAIVVGFPLMMNGKIGFLADEVTNFISLLAKATTIPIVTWDERLTSVQAERSLREGHMSRKRRTAYVDTVAAVIILQNYLDSLKITTYKPNPDGNDSNDQSS